jgi:hypothetical protein
MPLTKAQGKRLRLGESGGDRPAERRFLYRAAQFGAMCDGGQSLPRVCSSQKSSCAGASGNHSEAKAVSDMLPTFDKPE